MSLSKLPVCCRAMAYYIVFVVVFCSHEETVKDQLISKGHLFWYLQIYQKTNEQSLSISAIASKKRSNQKNKGT